VALPFWDDDIDAWDSLQIEDIKFEELDVTVDGDLGNNFDVKQAPGTDGAPATNKGYERIKPKVLWTMYTDVHWELYQELLAKVQPKPGKAAPVVVTVIHPQLQVLKKEKFEITKISTLKKVGPQMMQAQFDLLEHFPTPKPIPDSRPKAPTDDTPRERAVFDPLFDKPSNNPKPEGDSDVDGGLAKNFGEG